MNGYIITKKVRGIWKYYLSGLSSNGTPIWNGLKNNAKSMNMVNAMLVRDKLEKALPLEYFEITEY